MLGLPPSPERVEALLADERPDAWDCLVEEVLASPHCSERWATHWLDLVRFGETHGFETNRERLHAWHSCALFVSDNVAIQIDSLAHAVEGEDQHPIWLENTEE